MKLVLRVISWIVESVLVVWCAGMTLWMLFNEGLFSGILADLLGRVFDRTPARAGAFQAVLHSMVRSYDTQWSNGPWMALLIAAGVLCGYILLGWLMVASVELYAPVVARLCLALVVGTTAVGIGTELLGIFGLLHRPWVMGVWGVLTAGALWGFIRQRRDWSLPYAAPGGGRYSLEWRHFMAGEFHRTLCPWPRSIGAWAFLVLAWLLIGLISFVLTLHAVGEPESYWDSLILYMGYARQTFLDGRFPVKIVGQVGIGLGANYPHLYAGLTAQTAVLAGYWSDSFAQLLPPVAGLAATVLVYYTTLELSRSRLIAVACALLFRAVPYGLSYTQFASDYAIAILYTSAFLYAAVKYIFNGLPTWLWMMLIICAGAVHINYLMWALWLIAALVIFAAHVFRARDTESSPLSESHLDEEYPEHAAMAKRFASAPGFLVFQQRTPFFRFAFSTQLWFPVVIALILASPWYIRNLVLTGNPVYAFYSNIFTGSVRVNPEVMRSAQQEWLENGDGLGTVGRTLTQKLRNSWLYFVSGSQNWKLLPVFSGFVWPGVVMALLLGLWQLVARTGRHETDKYFENRTRALLPALALFGLLWFYAYAVADYYLYQIIVVLPLFGFFAAFLFMGVRTRVLRGILLALCLVVGFAPGLVMALMGSKLKNTGVYQGMPAPQMNLTALRKLFMNRDMFYRMEFGGDMEMMGRVNAFPESTVILTHENRHLLLNPKHKIVHLDDWEVQAAYRKPAAERVAILDGLKVEYYWYVPNEDNHVINMLAGMDELIEAGYFVEVYRTAASGSSNLEFVKHSVIPPSQNVLYKRTEKKPGN